MSSSNPTPPTPGMNDASGDGIRSLISVNDLTYVLEPDLSCAVNRTHKRHFFQSNDYTNNQNAICILNSGADYIDPRRSFLEFEIEIPDYAIAYLGKGGSICNIIRQLTVSTRSGDEISRVTEYAHLMNMLLPYSFDDNWFEQHGDLLGFNDKIFGNKVHVISDPISVLNMKLGQPYLGDTVTGYQRHRKFCIPMYLLSPFFQYSRLLPAMIMSGLRIEIEWNKPEIAFMQFKEVKNEKAPSEAQERCHFVASVPELSSHPIPTFTVKKLVFNLCSVQLSDAVQRALNEFSAVNGLELVYTDFERTEAALGGTNNSSNQAYIEVRKSCSRALKAYARVYDVTRTSASDDSFRGDDWPVMEYQWQLGSLYFPNQSVKAEQGGAEGTSSIAPQAFSYFMDAIDQYHPGSKSTHMPFRSYTPVKSRTQTSQLGHLGAFIDSSVDGCVEYTRRMEIDDSGELEYRGTSTSNCFERYQNGSDRLMYGAIGTYARDQHVIGVSLERSNLFNLAGVPVNNSRVLALRLALWQPSQYPIKTVNRDQNTDLDWQKSPWVEDADGSKQLLAGPNSQSGEGTFYVWDTDTYLGETRDNSVTNRRVFVYLKYVKLARVFLNNVEVEQ